MASVKFSDLMKTRLTGLDVEYTDWLQRCEAAIKVTKASDQDAVALLQAWREGLCPEEAEKFFRQWEEFEDTLTAGLKDHLDRAAAVVSKTLEDALGAAEIAEVAYAASSADAQHRLDIEGLDELNFQFHRQSLTEPRSRAVHSVQELGSQHRVYHRNLKPNGAVAV